MNLYEFFSDPFIQLPIHRDKSEENDFLAFVESRLAGYLDRLNRLDVSVAIKSELDAQRPNIEAFANAATHVVRLAFEGHTARAYDKFADGIGHLTKYLDRQSIPHFSDQDIGSDLGFNVLYRVRKQISPQLAKEEMFHIPYELRHLVAPQRYSVPGLPCLYLAGSLYTCWSEMGRPPFHEIQAAAFWLKESTSVKIINFANRPKRLMKMLDSNGQSKVTECNDELIVNHLILWPLMALCSVKVKFRDSPYKPEYIIPQRFMQWITGSLDFDGICYFSTHVRAISPYPLETCNVVLPAKIMKTEGRCARLRSFFKLTDPLSWELLKAIDFQRSVEFSRSFHNFEFSEGIEEPYWTSDFGQIETKLKMIAFEMKKRVTNGESSLGDVAE